MSEPPGDGWIPWARSENGRLRLPPSHQNLKNGERLENHYEVDVDERTIRLECAWSRKI